MEAASASRSSRRALTAIGVLVAVPAVRRRLADDGVPYWLAIVAVPAVIQFRALEAVLRAQGRFGAMNAARASRCRCRSWSASAPSKSTLGLTIIARVVAWSLAFLPPRRLRLRPARADRLAATPAGAGAAARLTVRFGVQGQLSNLIQLLNYRLDSYLVLLFVNTAGVGLYAVGVSLSEGHVVHRQLGRGRAADQPHGRRRGVRRAHDARWSAATRCWSPRSRRWRRPPLSPFVIPASSARLRRRGAAVRLAAARHGGAGRARRSSPPTSSAAASR